MCFTTGPKEPIAIVGSACRFAGGVNSPSKLWELLQKPRDVRSQIPGDRFNVDGFYHPKHSHHGHSNVRHSYMLEQDPALFDAEFFGINPMEARAMDPQQRLLLETVYEAVESAGMTIEGLRGSDTGVYAGLMCGDYDAILLRDLDVAPTYWAVGTSRAVLSNRVSYFFDWHGASMTVDTACSSSLVAVHHAIQALRAGDTHMAVACGANLILGPEMYIVESKVKMLSPDGLGRMWDKDANGYARGEGVGAVILKTLSQALADNDHIECVIRETGLNQDGATTGLTMPSAAAQRELIHSTYRKAGLDLNKPSDRPQFFEAHGTGTPAGDPVEAEAICRAFFTETGEENNAAGINTLHVGSIKTVLGHTEGTAGIAALLKASLALQNSTLPPNLLFNSLNPDVLPFYDHLEIPKSPKPWPQIGTDTEPRRASVNSFGFGGTNAHAILESYVKPSSPSDGSASDAVFTPFVFSAASELSLRSTLAAFATHLENNPRPQTGAKDLAYTLRERRSVFSYRASFSAKTAAELEESISSRLQDTSSNIGTRMLGKAAGVHSRILGVFTGQGAQYARMGAELVRESSSAHQVIQTLDKYLAELPDAPTWSLEAELLAGPENSHVSEAAISQPLCTAIQIMVVSVLRSAGVQFDAVVGHSSGEIAAAYAADFLTARDAICVAYYRGLHCRHACSPNGEGIKGAMMAVGTTMEDALELCGMEETKGRVGLAAVNSSSNVTLSGDEDAIEELRAVLSDENRFNRRLKVDQAYHSKHMLPCSEPYVESLRRAGIKAQKSVSPSSKPCTWFSSVYDGKTMECSSSLNGTYWTDNMTRPVLFAQAIKAASMALAAEGQSIDAAVEVGPHAALRGPASQTLEEALGKSVPYTGTLVRGQDSVASLSASLGFLWCHLDKTSIDLGSCERTLSGQSNFTVLKGLPSYQWNHSRHWFESRRSRRLRLRSQPFHPLLGNPTPETSAHVMRWKNVLKPSEIPWVEGHQVQGQIVFPAAGYVTTAIEAARSFTVEGTSIKLIELTDFQIHQAVMFDANDSGIEVLIELSDISRQSATVTANFTYSAAIGEDAAADLVLAAQGRLKILLGKETSVALLPERLPHPPHMIPVDESRLYSFMEGLEYNFSGPFRSLTQLRRKLGYASCVAKKASTDDCASLLVHPADLDAAFQSVMLAYSYPGDDQLRLLHLPTSISVIRVNPAAILDFVSENNGFTQVDSSCSREDRLEPGAGFSGNVSMYYSEALRNAAVQVEHVKFKPVGTTASDDRNVFYKMHFVPSKPDGDLAAEAIPITQDDKDLLWILSRISTYFLRQFDDSVAEDAPARTESPLCHYLHYARHMTNLIRKDEHQWAKKEWLNDTLDDVMNEIEAKGVAGNSDIRIMLLVGHTMPRVFAGETTMLEHFRESGLLDEYYAHGFGTLQSSIWLSNAVKQVTDRHPHLSLLEVGAGTGGATKNILRSIGHDFDQYTFTDISSSFFENAAEALAPWGDRMVFSVFNAEIDPTQQGFKEGAYDVIVAYMVIHATARLDEALRNMRKLLKPGGYLIIGEGASNSPVQAGAGFIFGTLPGWWRGVEEGRVLSPLVSADEWDELLKRTGYAGIDTMSPPRLLDTFGISLFVAQAVDARIDVIRQPLVKQQQPLMKKLIILGGQTTVAGIAEESQNLLSPLADGTSWYKRLEDMPGDLVINHETTILSFLDLETPVFKDMTAERWYRFKGLFTESTVLWLTTGCLADEPYCNMTVGFGRSAVHEEEELRLQFVDVPNPTELSAKYVAESLVRFVTAARQLEGQTDILYTMEPEVIVDDEGRELVPRLKAIGPANDRLNSIQRPITHLVSAKESVIQLHQDGGGYMVRDLSRYELEHSGRDIGADAIELTITHAILSAISTSSGSLFVVLAVDSNGTRHLALVPALISVIVSPKAAAINCEGLLKSASMTEEALLTLVAAQLVAAAVVKPLRHGQKLLLHNAPRIVVQALAAHCSAKDASLTLTTDRDVVDSADIIKLAPYLGRTELRQLLDLDQVACFVGLSEEGSSETEINILSALPPYCRRESVQTLFSANGPSSVATTIATDLGQDLRTAISNIWGQAVGDANVVSLEALAQGDLATQVPLTVVKNWACSSPVPARITRFDTKPLFKADKTYWSCGLSGALGISLCDWMIEKGVRHLVLTSRNPKIEPAWIENHARRGVVIKILLCDVTDEAALRRVHRTIVETMPPIAGALNAAMVLRDVSIRNMDFDQFQDVVRPKVLGSFHLDSIFHDVDLDFFVLISSINCVIGNVGQANYAAANMGMCGVAANRRKRGLRSSVANVGAIIGVGYITQSDRDRQLDNTVAKTAMIHLSEEDFHQIFVEAMEAGHLDSDAGPEISTGLHNIVPGDLDAENMPKWFSDPKFSRFIIHRSTNKDDRKKDQVGGASLPERLQACTSQPEVVKVVQEAFGAQLRKILQTSLPDEELMTMRSVDLGLDSLISVDIRSWFAKNLRVSIPVLKIMANDAQMSSLTNLAVEGLPADFTPLVGGEQGSNSTTSPSSSTDEATSTPQQTSTSPSSVAGDASPSSSCIDWDAETCPPQFSQGLESPRNAPRDPPRVVLLTGSSGLLGHHLLDSLLAQPGIDKVICAAVRQLGSRLQAKQLPAPSNRVVYYEGDLTQPNIGLAESDAEDIFREVDAVVHNGSDTSHLKYYTALRDANVGSTKQLLQLCHPRKVPVHYVSSAGVALVAGLEAFPEISCTTIGKQPPADGSHGYMCGKWVCESMLERVHSNHPDWKVVIQRPSTIIREGSDAAVAKAEFDWVNALLHYSHKIKAVPRVDHNKGTFDLVSVQTVCKDIVRELLTPTKKGSEDITYVNNVGDVVIPMGRMNEIGNQKGYGGLYSVLPMEEWAVRAIEAGLHPAVAALIETFDEAGVARYPQLLRERRD